MNSSGQKAVWLLACCTWWMSQSSTCDSLEGIRYLTSIKALHDEMYRQQQGTGGAYMLLNATGRIGSQGSPDFNVNVDAPLIHYSNLDATLQSDVAVLLPIKQSVKFMQELQSNSAWQQHLKGVLVDDTDPPDNYSTAGPFPLAEYAPYNNTDYVWNKAAGSNAYPSSITWFSMPVFRLTRGLAVDAQQRASYNAGQDPRGELYHVSLKLTMTSYNSANSQDCITAGTCKPLGGYSVWSAVPPVPIDQGSDRRPIILVVAQIDSIDMFHDNVQGADAPLSGLIAVLGALSVLHSTLKTTSGAASSYNKRLVFLALAGEPWGYMGSRRLLYEAATASNNTAGLDLSLVEKVIEIGQVGRLPAVTAQTPTMGMFAHSQQGAGFGDTTDIRAALTAAAQGESSAAKVSIQTASASNPGIPPSSLMSFLRYNRSIQGVVLAEFDTGYTNPYYGSRFDNGSTLNTQGIAAAAAVVAGALHRLAGGDPLQMKINMTTLQEAISGCVSCIAMPVPGFACPLAAAIMSATCVYNKGTGTRSCAPQHYIGVLQDIPNVQLPATKNNMARFLWNVMAFDSSEGPAGASCDPYKNVCPAGQVCAGWRSNSDQRYLGRCLNSTVRYVPSYSTKLICQNCEDPYRATWALTDAADVWNQQYSWPPDPVWAESDWPQGVPDLQLYLKESDKAQLAVLVSGLLVTAVVTVASFTARTAFHKHHKSS